MTEHTPILGRAELLARISTRVTVANGDVFTSGTVLTKTEDGLTIHIHDLVYEIVFEDDAKEQGGKIEKITEKQLRLVLSKFTNPLLITYRVPWKGTVPQRVRIPPGKLSLQPVAIGADDGGNDIVRSTSV